MNATATQSIRCLVVLVLLTGQAVAQASAKRPLELPRPIVTRQQAFTIPFQVPHAKDFVEVQLHVSEYPALRWELYSRQRPSAGEMRFRAVKDGQYVFAVRSIDRVGRQYPASVLRPEMLVIVDTVPPKLDLTVQVGSAGELQAQWRVVDEHIEASSLQLEYQAEPGTAWVSMAVESSVTKGIEKDAIAGQANWWPHSAAPYVRVRGRVKDRAGNVTVVQRQIELPGVSHDLTRSLPTGRQIGKLPGHFERTHGRRADGGIPWSPEDRTSSAGVDRVPRHEKTGQSWVQRSGREGRSRKDLSVGTDSYDSRFNHRIGKSDLKANDVSTIVPLDVTCHQTQTAIFSLDYQLKRIGPTGVRAVHLWGTSDAGQTWTKWVNDPDCISPICVEAPSAGVYGFRIVVESNEGLALPVPQPGDIPDVWVAVDPIEPRVELTSAQYGRGANEGSLLITWTASDDHLSSQPVTLQYASDPAVGWQTIVTDLPNSGQYTWRVDRDVTQQIFLRIEARDLAGNVGVHQLQEPINTRGLVPQAHIQGLQSHHEASSRAQRQRAVR